MRLWLHKYAATASLQLCSDALSSSTILLHRSPICVPVKTHEDQNFYANSLFLWWTLNVNLWTHLLFSCHQSSGTSRVFIFELIGLYEKKVSMNISVIQKYILYSHPHYAINHDVFIVQYTDLLTRFHGCKICWEEGVQLSMILPELTYSLTLPFYDHIGDSFAYLTCVLQWRRRIHWMTWWAACNTFSWCLHVIGDS